MCTRIQLQRKRGWRMPENTKKADRSTKYGNPYIILWDGESWLVSGPNMKVESRHKTQAEATAAAVALYKEYIQERMAEDPGWLEPLRGFNLACWCKPGNLCHVDVLLEALYGEVHA